MRMLFPILGRRLATVILVLALALVAVGHGRATDLRGLHQVSGLPEPVKLQLTKLSNTIIPAEKRACEGSIGTAVGDVVKSMEAFDAVPWSYACTGAECWLMASSCKQGQKAECGQRFLRFRVEGPDHVDPGSFQCVDVP